MRFLLFLSLAAAAAKKIAPGRRAAHVEGSYLVELCHESHRAHVAHHIAARHADPDLAHFEADVARHVTKLKRLPLVHVTGASAGAVADLEAHEAFAGKVCRVHKDRVTHATRDRVTRAARPAPAAMSVVPEDEVKPEGAWWHLDRINQAVQQLDGDAAFSFTGAGANIFVLDTGLDTTDPAFANVDARAVANVASVVTGERFHYYPAWGWDDAPDDDAKLATNDVDGHGTHCAGTCCGVDVGVAPGANLFGMKNMDDDGTGRKSWDIELYEDIAALAGPGGALEGQPVILSASYGGDCSEAYSADPDVAYCVDDEPSARAIDDLWDLGVVVAVAAGNEADDACYKVPAAAARAVTVGMSAVDDSLDPDSNTGSCVTVVAPGVKIASASSDLTDYDDNDAIYDEDGNIVVWTGTSMATPMVAGALALYAEAMGGGGAQTVNALLRRATTGVLTQTTDRDTACVGNDRLLRGPGDGGDLDGSDLGEEPCALPAGYYACLVDCDCAGLAADGCGGACDAWEQRFFLRKACASNDAPPFSPTTCEDTPGWVDSNGDGCTDYESGGWCARWGWFGEFTPTGPANLNCCACRAYIAQHDAEFERRPTWEGGWCAGGADRCWDDIYNRADCWAKCVKKMGDDLVAADFWIHDDGQCCCQDACVCATEVGIPGGETLVKVPVCADDGEWFAKKAKKDCDWVAKKTASRCKKKDGDKVKASVACGETCGGGCEPFCATSCAAEDDDAWYAKKEKHGCKWAGKKPEKRCSITSSSNPDDGRAAADACPSACGCY